MLWGLFGSKKKPDLTQDLQSNEEKIKKLDKETQILSSTKSGLLETTAHYLRNTFVVLTAIVVFFDSPLPSIATPYINIRLDIVLMWMFAYILILYGKLLIEYVYQRRINNRTAYKKELLAEQKLKIEEFKKATKYNETAELLRRFEDPPKPAKVTQQPSQVGTSNTRGPLSPNSQQIADKATFLDRVLDKIVGEEDFEHKYALICKQCHTHNGLCPQDQYSSHMFKCRVCKFLNMGPQAVSPVIQYSSSQSQKLSPTDSKPNTIVHSGESSNSSAEHLDGAKNDEKSEKSFDNISLTSQQSH